MEQHGVHLAHHFETREQQHESSKLGMWIFLATEVLLFGGLFCAYAIYRAHHPEVFQYAHHFLDKQLGGLNTLVLIASSFTMAWAVRAAQLGQKTRLIALLSITLLCAFGFLGVKAVEYEHKWKHGLLWGKHYQPVAHDPVHEEEEAAAPTAAEVELPAAPVPGDPDRPLLETAQDEPRGLARPEAASPEKAHLPEPKNVQLFFSVYFVMTGLHGLHVIAGMAAIFWILALAVRNQVGAMRVAPVDSVGLYWHLVDLIWIFLFPLLYLIH